jgi:hypothetical protein
MIGISYARISTAGQAGGSSIARQSANPEAYCRARGWRLWEGPAYSDPGVSAFAGDHLQGGDLGRFLADHRAGRFGGEPVALLLEDVDRFSRAFPLAVLPVLVDDVLNAGITLSLTSYGKDYSRESIRANPLELQELLMRLAAAHEFSERLSRRITFAHQQRRQAIRAGQPAAPGLAPSWLELSPDGWQFNAYATVVRRVLELTAEHGAAAVARQMNAEGIPSPGEAVQARRQGNPRRRQEAEPRRIRWSPSTVQQLVSAPQIHGARPIRTPGHSARLRAWKEKTAQLARQGVPRSDWPPRPNQTWEAPQEGYYPALLTPAEHADLLAQVTHRAPPEAGRTDRQRWIASTMTWCVCGERMGATGSTRLQAAGIRRFVYLRCHGAGRHGTCTAPLIALPVAQAHLLVRLTGDDFAVMLEYATGQDRAAELAAAIQQQQTAELAVIRLQQQQRAGDAAMAVETDPTVLGVLARRQAALDVQAQDAARQLAAAQRAVAKAQAAPTLAALGDAARKEISATLRRFAAGEDTEDDRRMVWRHLRALGLRITIDTAGLRMALQIGDGPTEWQPVDRDLGAYALDAAATGVTFGDGIVSWET